MPTTPTVFRGTEAIANGAVTATQLRSRRFVRLFRNTYATRTAPLTHELHCRAVALFAPPDSVITDASAATLRGVPLAGPENPVDLLVSPARRISAVDGLVVRVARTTEAESTPWHGIRLAKPERLIYDMLRSSQLPDAVAGADACLRAGLTTLDALNRYLDSRHDHGIRQARRARDFIDPRSTSVPESRLRVLLNLEGLHPTPQLTILDGEHFVATVALGFEHERVAVVLSDADPGLDETRHLLNRLTMAGWQAILVSPTAVHTTPHDALAKIHYALRRTTPTRHHP
ncbi:hypothetical protein NLX83_04370 [Allokutzneria sp. A3M-2-11 16]|uniref:hypothetical protein n=1 Tax=Allokutzneria sp. A3M-2-11 16 TaxID=2962043 RepID=UPI0020B7097D|nr:hypothetical protein [Allokutzneria sp. A3M-2-11 16]MCP3798489.1 hypothetical protein [Allokutzneria sp. A3M-2-11 16]